MPTGIRAHGEVFFVVYDTNIDRMSSPGGDVYAYVRHKTESSRNAAELLAPVRSGRLKGGIRIDVRQTSPSRVIGRVRSTARHSQWVHEGTGPFIYPQNGDFMRLRPGGGYGFIMKRVVRGQRANPFLNEALAIGMFASYPTPLGPANPFV